MIELNTISAGKLKYDPSQITNVFVNRCDNEAYAQVELTHDGFEYMYFCFIQRAIEFERQYNEFVKLQEQKNINKYHENEKVSIEKIIKIDSDLVSSVQTIKNPFDDIYHVSLHLHHLKEEQVRKIMSCLGKDFYPNHRQTL